MFQPHPAPFFKERNIINETETDKILGQIRWRHGNTSNIEHDFCKKARAILDDDFLMEREKGFELRALCNIYIRQLENLRFDLDREMQENGLDLVLSRGKHEGFLQGELTLDDMPEWFRELFQSGPSEQNEGGE